MVQDPATGEWRNAEPGEIPGVEGGGEMPTTLSGYQGEEAAAPPPAGGSEAGGAPETDTQGEYAIPEIEQPDLYQQPPPPPPASGDELLTTEPGWPSFDLSQQHEEAEAGWAEPGGAAEEPAGYDAYQGFEDPTLTDPSLTEPGVPDEGFDDASSP